LAEHKTLAELLSSGYKAVPVRERLAWAVQERQRQGKPLFTDIYGLDHELRRIVEVSMAGKSPLLTGIYGTAKTDIAKQLLTLLNEYHAANPVYTIKDCPIQEDALNLAYSGGWAGAGREACPLCRHRYAARSKLGPDTVPVQRLEKLVEGAGFARLQGGSDVLPEEVIGTYNIAKLAQLGDPFSPEVFQPGKIGQASNGLLFVDEIGKLGEAGQYALIEASQEGQFSPAKSREKFPVDLLLIATTNPVDEDDIAGAVLDRCVSIGIPIVSHKHEVAIAYKGLQRQSAPVYLPRPLADLAVGVIRQLRASSGLELGHRTSDNACQIAASSARLEGRTIVSYCDIKEGVYAAVLGKARHAEKAAIEGLLQKAFPKPAGFFRKYFPDIKMDIALKEARAYGRLGPAAIEKALGRKRRNLTRLAAKLRRSDPRPPPGRLADVIASLLDSYLHGCATPRQ
jgi:MoxR-like ATPase